jgi:hypothetical protein
MRIHAYVLVSELPWLKQSVQSYYDYVDKIVVSYDSSSLSWTKRPLELSGSLALLKEIDTSNKMVFVFDNFHESAIPLENETAQRRFSLNIAAQDADWVLQLDTDELITNMSTVVSKLKLADSVGASELWYPSLWVYNQTKYFNLVHCNRLFRPLAGYPGPIAVKGSANIICARQTDSRSNSYVVGEKSMCPIVSSHGVDPDVTGSDWILHMSWVRESTFFDEKARNNGHAYEFDWMKCKQQWQFAARFPLLHCLLAPFIKGNLCHERHTLVFRK